MRYLICGGRDFADTKTFAFVMRALNLSPENDCIIQGGAPGADEFAKRWAASRGIACLEVTANWSLYGTAGGPIRNKWMLKFGKPDLVIAFPGGVGTAGMVKLAKKAGIAVDEVKA